MLKMDILVHLYTVLVAYSILQQVYADKNSMVYVEKGLTATLKCPMKPVLYWKDYKGTIYSFDLTVNDIEFTDINITNDYNLVIHHVSSVDERTYICEMLDQDQIVRIFNITLVISKDPTDIRIQNLTNLKEVVASEGEQLQLTCTVNGGIPAESLKWFLDQPLIAVGGPQILIHELTVKRSNDGQNFTCVAMNNITNTTLKQTISLHVYLKPKVFVKASPSTNVDEGKQFNLSCYYESNIAQDSVYWYKFLYEQTNVSTNGSFNLSISNSSKDDRGTYFCKVKNRVGIGVANITVTVKFRPTVIVHHKNYTTQLEKAKRISLKVESYPEPSASWAKSAGGKLGVWNVSKYEDLQFLNTYDCTFYLESSIKPTNEEHFGLYMVAIRNDIGSIELPVQLHIERISVEVLSYLTSDVAHDIPGRVKHGHTEKRFYVKQKQRFVLI